MGYGVRGMDVGETSGAAGQSVLLRVHSLLLALAGRIDDSVLTNAHELVARADVDEAAELTTGTLIAGGIAVRAAEQRELATILELNQCDTSLADELVVDDSGSAQPHRFSSAVGEHPSPEAGVAEAIERVTRVLPDVRTVHAVWRLTPAGAVPGPLPTRVVLIEVGSEANPPAVAYRIDGALRHADISAVVEVLSPESGRSRYHEAALAAARRVGEDECGDTPADSVASEGYAANQTPKSHGPAAPRIAQARPPDRSPTPEAPVREVPDVVEASQSQLEHYERGPVGDVETPREPGRSSEPNSVSRPEQEPNVWVPGPPAFTTDRGGAGDGAVDHGGLPCVSEPWQSACTEPVEGTAAGPDPARGEQQPEDRVASTTERTPAEMPQLRQALAEDPVK